MLVIDSKDSIIGISRFHGTVTAVVDRELARVILQDDFGFDRDGLRGLSALFLVLYLQCIEVRDVYKQSHAC